VELELFSAAWLSALLAIILIDLVLAGDNALVIGLAARKLPKETQRKVIFWGTFGAIAIRAAMAMVVVWILAVPGFMLAGGIALVWIARKLLMPAQGQGHGEVAAASTFGGAIRTIVIADAVMGIDNVIAIGGAAQGSMLLVVIGLMITVPIIVWGSQLVIKLVDRYPWVIMLGGAVLAWTAYKMITGEPSLKAWFAAHSSATFFVAVLCFAVSLAPWYGQRLSQQLRPLTVILPGLMLWLIGFEVAASVWQMQAEYAQGASLRDYAFQAARWVGWVPLALGFLVLNERADARRGKAAQPAPGDD